MAEQRVVDALAALVAAIEAVEAETDDGGMVLNLVCVFEVSTAREDGHRIGRVDWSSIPSTSWVAVLGLAEWFARRVVAIDEAAGDDDDE